MNPAKLFDLFVTYNDKCSICASPTVALDWSKLHGRKVCLRCALDQIDAVDLDTVSNLEYDLEEVANNLEVCTEGYEKLVEDNKTLQDEVTDLQETLEAKENLIRSATQECDALRKKSDEFDDDSMAIQNENARLKLDIQKFKEHMRKHGQLQK